MIPIGYFDDQLASVPQQLLIKCPKKMNADERHTLIQLQVFMPRGSKLAALMRILCAVRHSRDRRRPMCTRRVSLIHSESVGVGAAIPHG